MNRLTIDLISLRHNLRTINDWMVQHGATWTLVTKVLCGHADALRALQKIGVRSMGDSRLENIEAIERVHPDFEAWYLRLPHMTAIPDVIRLANASLNSEIETIKALDKEARRQNRIHRIIVMIELGDLREGILPGHLMHFYEKIFELQNIECLGIGANLGCLSGAVPSVDQLTQLALYKELLELKFNRPMPMISAGTSATLPLLLDGLVPKAINHFRIGESVFLGTDLINEGTLPGLRDDAITLEAEIVEIKEKSLVPFGETSSLAPFEFDQEEDTTPGQRGYRAIVTIGGLDTELSGLTPTNPNHKIAGGSSDLLVVNIGEDSGGLRIGDVIRFRLNYTAFVRLMAGQYVEKVVVPPVSDVLERLGASANETVLPRLIDKYEENGNGDGPVVKRVIERE